MSRGLKWADIADMYRDFVDDCSWVLDEVAWLSRQRKPGEWVAKGGHILLMKEMDTDHIRNCVRLLERNNRQKHPLHAELMDELRRRWVAARRVI